MTAPWPERLNTVALALVCAVIAPIIGVRAVGSLVARAARPVGRRIVRLARRVRGALSLRGER